MDFEFKLPPGWTSRLRPNGDSYEFWMVNDPTHTFTLTKLALEVYGDDPVWLSRIITMQMEMLENSKNARTAKPMGISLPSYTAPPVERIHRCAYDKNGKCIDCGKIKPEQKIVQHKKPDVAKFAGIPDDYFDTTIDLPSWIHPDWQRFVNWIYRHLRPAQHGDWY
jgi:hypothetical protein